VERFLLNDEVVRQALYEVYDPELGVNIIDLGLVYRVDVEGSDVRITMTLTTPGCPLHDMLTEAVDQAVRTYVPTAGKIVVDLVWDPPWSPDMITTDGLRELGMTV